MIDLRKITALLTAILVAGLANPTPAQAGLRRTGKATNADTASQSATSSTKRAVTIGDVIRMTRFADPLYSAGLTSKGIVASFSPDQKHFIVVVRKGNLERNTNEYSLLLFETGEALSHGIPRVLAILSSSSNRPAIRDAVWLDDSDTIMFLGEQPGESTELYSVKSSSAELKRLTDHATNLAGFAISTHANSIVYVAELPPVEFAGNDAAHQRNEIEVTNQSVVDLIKGSTRFPEYRLFTRDPERKTDHEIRLQGKVTRPELRQPVLSPDGNYFVIQTEARDLPDSWDNYEDKFLQVRTRRKHAVGSPTSIYRWEIVDCRTGASRVLIDAPLASSGSEAVWSPDSRSVFISDTYLPLDVDNRDELLLRKSHPFLVEIVIQPRSPQIIKVSDEDLRIIRWDNKSSALICDLGRTDSMLGKARSRVAFYKHREQWSELDSVAEATGSPLDIILEEDSNTPPRLVARDPVTGRKSLLLDLNPNFKELSFAHVERVTWKDLAGNDFQGGLYWPPGYREGIKYPLIIQTHGFKSDRFWIDGPYTTAVAAQPLASKGFFVLQVPDPEPALWDTPEEVPRAMSAYDGAIDYLNRRGLIDLARIGLVGFSRTCTYVTYTLVHSQFHIAAAAITDGGDAGYFQYMAFPGLADEYELLNGSLPFSDGLREWIERSPPFQMDKVRTPLLVTAIGPGSLLSEWDWFSGLSRLNRPVYMNYIPDGVHILEKPWDRMTSQQGTVDWFCFWLQGPEALNPENEEKYIRWRELRAMNK